MKNLILIATALLSAGTLIAADSTTDAVKGAAAKLAAADSYSWTTTTEGGRGGGSSSGKIEKNGYTDVTFTMRDNTMEAITKGGKGAIKTEDGWQSLDEAANAEGGVRFMAARLHNFKAPATEAADIAGKAKSLAQTGDSYAGELTEDGAKSLLTTFRRPNAEPPSVSGAKGSVTFWVKDGVLTKYQYKVSGTVTFNGNDRDVDRTTTIEFKDVGTTKVTVPDEAKKKMN